MFGAWSSVRVSKAGHTTNESGQHVVLAQAHAPAAAAAPGAQVVCIIEAMKIMNEIESEVAGVVREVLVENAQPVEFGQLLFRVDPHA